MICRTVQTPHGAAIVCGPRPKARKCCRCGKPASLLCDWKMKAGKTCDKPLCDRCTVSPAPDKDLCPLHAKMYDDWKAGRS